MLDGLDKRQVLDHIENLERLLLYYVPRGVYDRAAWEHAVMLLEKLKEVVTE